MRHCFLVPASLLLLASLASAQTFEKIAPLISESVFTGPFIECNGKLYFTAPDSVGSYSFYGLWVTTGTSSGTSLLSKTTWPNSQSIHSPVAFNNLVFFIASGASDRPMLWRTDGTESGTIFIDSLPEYSGDLFVFKPSLFYCLYTKNWRADLEKFRITRLHRTVYDLWSWLIQL
jgi:hypothetical protein